ncbi:PleD family two-component system response regulator [Paracraurococcus ruber]|uniref:diguanylate cyclase n=1 Tax=Paracraurococcus ruber TaxID=77675 RepID=A0ABS1D8J4_9PROT|nr:PleD family two-component system response regulator [Paracraurococcus ruber]MBK1662194.1 PleD family two-component system response regulator [Paracraurococcus ruber]TDG14496.1 PleD family two-component system response regulator [Paracraurococcus ruber]
MTARILVVDDIPANLRLLEAKLLAEYYQVALASSGPEALAMAERWAPDVILLDVMMPGMDGYEVCRRLKAEDRTAHLPVVMVTALIDQAERVRGLEAGADDFLSKPVDDATMFARLRALLRMKQVQDAWRQRSETARELGIEPPAAPRAGTGGARALVLSDSAEERAMIAAALAADGMAVRQEAEAESARQALADSAFDLAVLCLPAEGGEVLRLASRLRADTATRDLPVLLAADPEQRGLVLRGFDLGASDHVLRPVDANELRARARNQVRRKWYQERLRNDLDRSLELAVTDPLTGLRNRRYVIRHLETLLRGADAGVMLLDVDRFKSINDRHGHAAGDAALREVAARLKAHLRAADVLARYGGEEFMVVLSGAASEYAAAVAERLRHAIGGEPIALGAARLSVTISIGLALAPLACPAEAAIGAADAALYRAKAAGRDRVEVAQPGDFGGPLRPPEG